MENHLGSRGVPLVWDNLCKLDDELHGVFQSLLPVDRTEMLKMGDKTLVWLEKQKEDISKEENGTKVNFWKNIMRKYSVKPDDRLFKKIMIRGTTNWSSIDLREQYLRTLVIREESSFHKFLMSRVNNEMVTYGNIPLYYWFAFFCNFLGSKDMLVRSVGGIVMGLDFPFKMTRNNSVIKEVRGVYNIINIVECLLTGMLIKYGLRKRVVTIGDKKIDFNKLINEIVLSVAIDPKFFISKIRVYIAMVVRYAGIAAEKHLYMRNDGWNFLEKSKLHRIKVNIVENNMKDFIHTDIFGSINEMKKDFVCDECSFSYLLEVCDILIHNSFYCDRVAVPRVISGIVESQVLDQVIDDYVSLCTLLLNIMTIGGFGRGLKYSTIPLSAPEGSEFADRVSNKIRDNLVLIHGKALEAGFYPEKSVDWESNAIGLWKTTSAGVGSFKYPYKDMFGNIKESNVTDKIMIGTLYPEKFFRRDQLSRKLQKSEPGLVAYRDVPIRATRAVYMVRMGTLHAQHPLTIHMQRYISHGKDEYTKGFGIDSENFTVGVTATSGIRAVDDYDTISVSGREDFVAVDIDLSAFDSHLVWSNFRKGMLEGLKEIFCDRLDTFGKDKITYEEMIDYAYGEGHIYKSWWDNSRKPILYIREEDARIIIKRGDTILDEKIFKQCFTKMVLGATVEGIRTEGGMDRLQIEDNRVYYELSIDEEDVMYKNLIDSGILRVGQRLDGEDFVFLTSEASGEYTTLFMNTIASLSMQDILLEEMKEVRENVDGNNFIKSIRLIGRKAVGDDTTMFFHLEKHDYTAQDVSDAIIWIKNIYEKMGHVVKPFVTGMMKGRSEYRQTYAIYGVLIPKDQICVIQSERERDIREIHNFLISKKRTYSTKISRGFNENSALVLFLFECIYLQSVTLKFHDIEVEDKMNVKIKVECDFRKGELGRSLGKMSYERSFRESLGKSLEENKIVYRKATIRPVKSKEGGMDADRNGFVRERFKKETRKEYLRFSALWAFLPVEVGGMGIDMIYFSAHVTSGTFLYGRALVREISKIVRPLQDEKYKNRLLVYAGGGEEEYNKWILLFYLFNHLDIKFGNRYRSEDMFMVDKVDSKVVDRKKALERYLFRNTEREIAMKLSSKLDLGRLNLENQPRAFMKKAIRDSKLCNRENINFNDLLFEHVLERISKPSFRIGILNDEWLLGLAYNVEMAEDNEEEENILWNLSDKYKELVSIVGLLPEKNLAVRRRDRLRNLISREPCLSRTVSPREIYDLLNEYDAVGINAAAKALHLMCRMGFKVENAQEIVRIIREHPEEVLSEDILGGSFSDDVLGGMNLLTRGIREEINVGVGFNPIQMLHIHNLYCFMKLYYAYFTGDRLSRVTVSLSDRSKADNHINALRLPYIYSIFSRMRKIRDVPNTTLTTVIDEALK
jgi:hypothetical protein